MPVFSTSRYSIHEGAAPDPAAVPPATSPWDGLATHRFVDGATGVANSTRMILIKTWDQRCYVRFSYDGVNWGDDILYDPDHPPVWLWYSAQMFQIRNATAGNICNHSVEGYW